MGYALVRRLARLLLGLFYRRVEVVGLDRVPRTGPLVVTANHQNALVDPMLLLATVPRRLRPLAKAPLFGHLLIGPFLRLTGAIPVHRRQDPGSDTARNAAMFHAARETLGVGGAILVFPEGVSQPEPVLMPLRTGTARLVLDAASAAPGGQPPTLLPVGLVFHEPGTFRAGWAVVVVGEPVPLADALGLARQAPAAAVRLVTERLAAALGAVVVEAGDRQTLRLAHVLEAVWREETPETEPENAASRAAWLGQAMRVHRHLALHAPLRLARLRHEVERYAKDLELLGLSGSGLPGAYPPGVVARYALREGLSLLAGLPLALWGLANHAVPYGLTALAVRLGRPTPDTEATLKLVAGLVLYPAAWALEGATAWWLGGGGLLVTFLLSLGPTGFFALTWHERLGRVRRDAWAFARFLADRDLLSRLRARRGALMAELRTLAGLVPPWVLDGTPDPGLLP